MKKRTNKKGGKPQIESENEIEESNANNGNSRETTEEEYKQSSKYGR